MSARRAPRADAPPPASGSVVCLGRSGLPPLRLRARLAGREAATLREGAEAAGVELTLWAREPSGWAAALQIDADGATSAHAIKSDSLDDALDWATRMAFMAFEAPAPLASGALSSVGIAACRRYTRTRLARRVAETVAAMAMSLAAQAAD